MSDPDERKYCAFYSSEARLFFRHLLGTESVFEFRLFPLLNNISVSEYLLFSLHISLEPFE